MINYVYLVILIGIPVLTIILYVNAMQTQEKEKEHQKIIEEERVIRFNKQCAESHARLHGTPEGDRLLMMYDYIKLSDFKPNDSFYPYIVRFVDREDVLGRESLHKELDISYINHIKYQEELRKETLLKNKFNRAEKLLISNGCFPGVYYFKNVITDQIYIGSSRNMFNRMNQHIELMKGLNHHSYKVNESLKEHGISVFEFYIITYCKVEELIETEQKFINLYYPFFNIEWDASGKNYCSRKNCNS